MFETYVDWPDTSDPPAIRFCADRVYGWDFDEGIVEIWPNARRLLTIGVASRAPIPGDRTTHVLGVNEYVCISKQIRASQRKCFYPTITPWMRLRLAACHMESAVGLNLDWLRFDTTTGGVWFSQALARGRLSPYGTVSSEYGVLASTPSTVAGHSKLYGFNTRTGSGRFTGRFFPIAGAAWGSLAVVSIGSAAVVSTARDAEGSDSTSFITRVSLAEVPGSKSSDTPVIRDSLVTVPSPERFIGDFEFTRDNRHLFVCTDRMTYVYEAEVRRRAADWRVGTSPVIVIPVGGRRMSIAEDSKQLAIWAVEGGQHVLRILPLNLK